MIASLGTRMKKLRKTKGVTQKDIRNVIKERFDRVISRSMYSKWENNEVQPDRLENLAYVALALSSSTDYLLGISNSQKFIRPGIRHPVEIRLGQRMRILRKSKKATQKNIRDVIKRRFGKKISKSMYSKWENAEVQPDRLEDIVYLAMAFNTSTDYLLGLSDSPELIEDKNNLSNDFFQVEPSKDTLPRLDDLVPILKFPTSQGDGIKNYEMISTKDGVDYCLWVKDDSMTNAHIYPGDIVYVKRQHTVKEGDIAVIIINDEYLMRRVHQNESEYILKAESGQKKQKPASVYSLSDVQIAGKIVMVKTKVK